jgi:hypothetical protein
MSKAKSATNGDKADSTIQILKEATCPTSSGKSTLGYQVGVDNSGGIFFKIVSNSGGGFWSAEWVDYNTRIKPALDAWPADTALTSVALSKVFHGRSSNNSSFLLVILKAESLVEPIKDRQRCHQLCDPAPFMAQVEQLLQKTRTTSTSKPATKVKTKTRAKTPAKAAPKAKTKTPRKTAAASRKRK